MSDDIYFVVHGRVAFDPETREAGDKTVLKVTVKSATAKQTLFQCTLWPELDGSAIVKGDFVMVEGKYTTNTGTDGKTYHNLSVVGIGVVPQLVKAERSDSSSGNGQVTNAVADEDSPF